MLILKYVKCFSGNPHEPSLLEIQKKTDISIYGTGEIHVTLFRGLPMTTVSINVGDFFSGLRYTLFIIYRHCPIISYMCFFEVVFYELSTKFYNIYLIEKMLYL